MSKNKMLWPLAFSLIVFLGVNAAAAELTLPDLYSRALASAEKIKIAEEQVKISEAGREKAKAALLPRFSGTASATRFSEDKRSTLGVLIQPESATSWGLRLEQSISLGGREFRSLNLSEEAIARSREDFLAIREDYLLTISQAYFDVLRTQKAFEIARFNLDRLRTHRHAAERRLRQGEITKTSLLRIEGELSGAQSDFIRAGNQAELARQYLIRLVGLASDFKLKEPPPAGEELPPLPTLKERALSKRAELKSLNRQKRVIEEQLKIAKSQYWPNVNFTLGYGGADQYPATATLNRESIFGSVGMSLPIFDGGLRRAEVNEVLTKLRQIDLNISDLQKAIEVEVEAVYSEIVTQRGMIKFHQDQVAFARDNLHAISRQFEFGLASSLDIIDANTLLVSAERKLAEAHYNLGYAFLKLKRVTGEPLHER